MKGNTKKTRKPFRVADIGKWIDEDGSYMAFRFRPNLKGDLLKFAKKWRSNYIQKGYQRCKVLRDAEKQGFSFLLDEFYPQFSKKPDSKTMSFYRKRHRDKILIIVPFFDDLRFLDKRNSDGSYNLGDVTRKYWIYGNQKTYPYHQS